MKADIVTRKFQAPRLRVALAVRCLLGVSVLLAAGEARADRREWYTVLGYEPGVSRYENPVSGSGSATKFASQLSLGAYYGLTNAFHVGGRVRVSGNPNIDVTNASVPLPDGSRPSGDLYEDHQSLGLGALVLFRIDTKYPLAPLLELEGGVTAHRFQRIAFFPGGAAHSYPQRSVADMAAYASVAALLEYRFLNRWVAAAGILARRDGGGLIPWTVSVPMRVGFVW